MLLGPPPGATVQQIIAYEQSRGYYDWTGPQGHADAWQLVNDWWNRQAYYQLYATSATIVALGRIG